MNRKKIVVIGSSNTDMVIKTHTLPRPGETVVGGEFFMAQGGKGANQAVAVARLGGDVAFICKVGRDQFGDNSIESYNNHGIDTSFIERSDHLATGIALITVDDNAENCIVVASGANSDLLPKDMVKVESQIESAQLVLMQLEIPLETVESVARIAQTKGVKVVLNPAPAISLPDDLLRSIYMITPNRNEAEMLSGVKVTDWDSAKQAANVISGKGVEIVIITLGSQGALIKQGDTFHQVPAEKVQAIDTTAAGDTFNGALCVAISEGLPLLDAVKFACRASAISVTRMGAQTSIPSREEIR